MGCDIHMRAETRGPDGWRLVGEEFKSLWGDGLTAEPWDGRNYDLFSILADVRNGYGFAGVAPPKGTPDDCDPATRAFMESYDVDGHSHSWHTLRDLREYDWDGQSTVRYGVVEAEVFERCRELGTTPDGWSGGVSGPGIVTFSEEGYERWKADGCGDVGIETPEGSLINSALGHAPDSTGVIERPCHVGEIKPHVRMHWTVTYRQAAGEAWFRTLDQLTAMVPDGGTEEDVRIVFFFDN
jgi:hypothetical protein